MSSGLRRPIFVSPDADLPPPRPGVRYVNVPKLGIVVADDRLRQRVNRYFHKPMLVLALLVLPVLGIEFLIRPPQFSLVWWLNAIAMAIIWIAFVVEFTVKVSIAECRLEYCKRNWLDMIIIAIPALRPLRLASVAKTTRVFTLRGVAMKFLRYAVTLLVGLEITERLMRRFGVQPRPDRPDPATMTRRQLVTELKQLRSRLDQWEDWRESYEEYLDRLEHENNAAAACGSPEPELPRPMPERPDESGTDAPPVNADPRPARG